MHLCVPYIFKNMVYSEKMEKKAIATFADHATIAPQKRVPSCSFRFIEREFLDGDAYPAHFIPPPMERDSHTPLEIANICGSISSPVEEPRHSFTRNS